MTNRKNRPTHCLGRLSIGALPIVLFSAAVAAAQQPPSIGYLFPPGGQPGQTSEVLLGGYDWTPDMQLFVHDPRIKLELLAPPGPVIVPEPPYWFGKKARRGPFPLPRETRARLTIPADVPAGIVRWQAANANGATGTGQFMIVDPGDAASPAANSMIVEADGRAEPQTLPSVPAAVFGRILKIEEVDRYQFTAAKAGPITCAITARALGSPLNAALQVHDAAGRLIADAADTAGDDTALTFFAKAGGAYTLSLFDVDFRGNRSFVYCLAVTPGPRVVAAIPAAGRPGETKPVQLFGYGVSTGAARLESVTRNITFPPEPQGGAGWQYRLDTPHGAAPLFPLQLSDLPEIVEPPGAARQLSPPVSLTGSLDEPSGEDRFEVTWTKGDVWRIELTAEKIASPLDMALEILDAEGQELARSDDMPGATDAALEFTVPADGAYQLGVTDISGRSGSPASTYRLAIRAAAPDFSLETPELVNAPIGGAAQLAIKATRNGGFNDPITISLDALPNGVAATGELTIPANKSALNVALAVADTAAASASLVTVSGEAKIGEQLVRRTAASPCLIAATLKPPFAIDAEGKDDVTKWPRGTTFPAPVLIQRDEGFQAEIVLEMAAKQGRHRQGIRGPELTVPPGVDRILYPIFLPEWLETTRTSRMVVNGVAKTADPQGNIRYSLCRQKTRMGFLPVGALLKLSTDASVLRAEPGQSFTVPLTISRSIQLTEPLRLELQTAAQNNAGFRAEPQTLLAEQTAASFQVTVDAAVAAGSEHPLTIRATALQNDQLPVIAEAQFVVQVESGK